jgi:hypothetical protein
MPRRTLEPNDKTVEKKNIMMGFMICTPQQVLLDLSNQGGGWVGCVACIKAMRSAYRILVTKPKGKRLPGTTKSMGEVNIKMEM